MSPSVFKQPSKVRVARTVRVLRRISIARVNWQTVLIRCAGGWMKKHHVATDSSKEINQGNSRDSKAASRDRDSKVNGANKVSKVRKASQGNKVSKVVSNRDNRLVDHKAVAARRLDETVAASIARG